MTRPAHAIPAWFLGLDLAQLRDYAALATLELLWARHAREFRPTLNLSGLTRYPHGTSYSHYPSIVDRRVRQIHRVTAVPDISLIVDAGGPGGPVIDELRQQANGVTLVPLCITAGYTPGTAPGGYKTVPRRRLISNLLLLMDQDVLRWPAALPARDALEHELLHLRKCTTHPDGPGANDDLVMATALAAWQATVHSPKILPAKIAGDRPQRWTPVRRQK